MNQFQKSQAEKIRSCYETTDLEKGGMGSGKYLHSKKHRGGITIHSNVNRVYNGTSVAPWDHKGEERGMTHGDLENIALESDRLSEHSFEYGKDNWNSIASKLKEKNINNLELYKENNYFKLRPTED